MTYYKFSIGKEVPALSETPFISEHCTPLCLECSICRTSLVAQEKKILKKCYSCGQAHKTDLSCPNGHYICKKCWAKITDCPLRQSPVKMRLYLAEKYGILPSDIKVEKVVGRKK